MSSVFLRRSAVLCDVMSGFGYHGGQGTVYLFSSVFIGVELLYHVVLISAVQQSESARFTHISPLFWISFPFRPPQSTEFPVPYSGFSLAIYFILSSVHRSIPISQVSMLSFPSWCSYACSLCLCLYFCFVNRFICAIFLDCTYMH